MDPIHDYDYGRLSEIIPLPTSTDLFLLSEALSEDETTRQELVSCDLRQKSYSLLIHSFARCRQN